MRSKPASYTIVTPANKALIAAKLKRKEGSLLIAEPGFRSFEGQVLDICLHLYHQPMLEAPDFTRMFVKRGSKQVNGEDWQTKWKNDREYWLRPVEKPTGDSQYDLALSFFTGLEIGRNYWFRINFQSAVGRGIFDKGSTTLYIPRKSGISEPFCFAFKTIAAQLRTTITEEQLAEIVAYVMKDLKTGQQLKANVDAGQAADVMFGL